MSGEKVIASLVGKLRFETDVAGLRKFQKMLDAVSARMAALDKQSSRLQRKLGGLGKGTGNIQKQLAAQQKLTQAQFQQTLQSGKLQLVQQQQGLRLATAQQKLKQQESRTSTLQQRQQAAAHAAQLGQLKTIQQHQQFGLRQEQQRLRVAGEAARLEASRSRAQAAADRARITSLRLQDRIDKRLPSPLRSPTGRRSPARGRASIFGGVGATAAGVGGAVGASIPGLSLFGAGLHPAAIGLSALAAATVLATSKLLQLAEADVKVLDDRRTERAQHRVLTGGDAEKAAAAEARLTKLANDLGVERSKIAKPYVMSSINLSEAGLGEKNATDVLDGVMSFSRGTGTSEDDMAGALRALGQAMSKGQLYAEEWKGQFAERIAGADKLGVEAWAKVTGSGLKGQDAKAAFSGAMSDGDIKGDKLNEFLIQLGKDMKAKANLEGRLDTILASAEASKNRLTNIKEARDLSTAEYNDSAVKKSSTNLFKAKEDFEHSLGLLVPLFSKLETAATNLQTKWTRVGIEIVEWTAKVSTALEGMEPSPELVGFMNSLADIFDHMSDALSPLLTLLGDVITFMGSTALGAASDSLKTFFTTFTDSWNGLSPLLEDVPTAFDTLASAISAAIESLLATFGLDDEWREHKEKREKKRADKEAYMGSDGPIGVLPVEGSPGSTPATTAGEVYRGGVAPNGAAPGSPLAKLLAKSFLYDTEDPANKADIERFKGVKPDLTRQALSTNLNHLNKSAQLPTGSSSTTTTDNRQVHVDIKIDGSNLSTDEIASALEDKIHNIAKTAFSDSFGVQLRNAKTNLVQVTDR